MKVSEKLNILDKDEPSSSDNIDSVAKYALNFKNLIKTNNDGEDNDDDNVDDNNTTVKLCSKHNCI